VLVLDGVIQLTERDEFVYQEMITHLPLFSHPSPKNILIVGGGDGGVLREVCRHKCVQSITMVEIDQLVIDVAKKFFSNSTATSFDDPRLTIVNEDAAEFLRSKNYTDKNSCYDIIIADTSDPVGPAESLFDPSFYEQMHDALKDGGIVCAQGECFWVHLDLIVNVVSCCSDIFDCVEYASTMVPSYPCGQIGFILAGKGKHVNFLKPQRTQDNFQSKLKWYNPSIHQSSFILPQFMEEKLAPLRPSRINYLVKDDEDNVEENECFLSQCSIS